MKTLILAAGYGTRLERDLKNETAQQHLIGVPKPLLPIGGTPLITHWTETLQKLPSIEAVYVVVNDANVAQFKEWSKAWPSVQLMSDGSCTNETRLGAVSCMNTIVKHFTIDDDLIVIAGDTLFYDDFDLSEIIDRFHKFQSLDAEASLVLYVTCKDEEVVKYGILEVDEISQLVGFLEKPQPSETSSRKECPCFYILSRHSLPLLQQFLLDTQDSPLTKRDAPGNFIKYLYKRKPVYAMEVSGRFDVGSLQSYILCDEHFRNRECKKPCLPH